MRTMTAPTAGKMLAGVTTLLLSALPLSAQEGPMAHDGTAHAEIGVVESIDFVNQTIQTAFPTSSGEEAVRTFSADQTTLVEGRGGIQQFSELTSRSVGHVVVVEFVPGENHPFARRLQFPATRTIRMTQGIITSVDREDQMLTLQTAEGTVEMDVDMGYGVTIDSADGLLEMSDLAAGQRITAYFSDTPMHAENVAYLIFKND